MHDMLHLGADVAQYDHHTFPGVVHRTFLGPFFVAIISVPLTSIGILLGGSKFIHWFIVRAVLACLMLGSFRVYRRAVRKRFGVQVSICLTLLTLSQFHFMLYSSRPLPNTMALVPFLLSLGFWLNSHPGGRLVLGLLAFFITCAFSSPPNPPQPATILKYVLRIAMWIVEAAMVLYAIFFCFFAFCVLKNQVD